MAKVIGVGGIFFKSKDPAAIINWYRDDIGPHVHDRGGVSFTRRHGRHPGAGTGLAPFDPGNAGPGFRREDDIPGPLHLRWAGGLSACAIDALTSTAERPCAGSLFIRSTMLETSPRSQ